MSTRTLAKNAERNVPELYEDSPAQAALLRTMVDLASRCIGVYEIRLRLYLWELFGRVEQKKNVSAADAKGEEIHSTGGIR